MGGGNSKKNTEYYNVSLHKLWNIIRNPLILDKNGNIYTVKQQFTLSTYLQNKDHYEPQLMIMAGETLVVRVGSNLFIDINVINNGIIHIQGTCINSRQNKGAYIAVSGLKEVTLLNKTVTSFIIIDVGSILEFNNASFILNETTVQLGGTLFLNNSYFSDTNAVLEGLNGQVGSEGQKYYGKVYVDGIPFDLGLYNTTIDSCKYKIIPFDNQTLATKRTWQDAYDDAYKKGYQLAVPTTLEEQRQLFNLVNSESWVKGWSPSSPRGAWLGIQKVPKESRNAGNWLNVYTKVQLPTNTYHWWYNGIQNSIPLDERTTGVSTTEETCCALVAHADLVDGSHPIGVPDNPQPTPSRPATSSDYRPPVAPPLPHDQGGCWFSFPNSYSVGNVKGYIIDTSKSNYVTSYTIHSLAYSGADAATIEDTLNLNGIKLAMPLNTRDQINMYNAAMSYINEHGISPDSAFLFGVRGGGLSKPLPGCSASIPTISQPWWYYYNVKSTFLVNRLCQDCFYRGYQTNPSDTHQKAIVASEFTTYRNKFDHNRSGNCEVVGLVINSETKWPVVSALTTPYTSDKPLSNNSDYFSQYINTPSKDPTPACTSTGHNYQQPHTVELPTPTSATDDTYIDMDGESTSTPIQYAGGSWFAYNSSQLFKYYITQD